MALLLALLPVYILGNIHCLGMCGPLAFLIGRNPNRYYYFLGRTLSFTLAGAAAGAAGAVVQVFFHSAHLSATLSIACGAIFGVVGLLQILNLPTPKMRFFSPFLQKINGSLSLLLLRETPFPVFLFGFFTIALPCGQTVLVYSACALEGDIGSGALNGLVFALCTSPALFLAMRAQTFLHRLKGYYSAVFGVSALLVGAIAVCRGFADMELIPHVVLNAEADSAYHIVLF